MRARILKPGFFLNEAVITQPMAGRLLFQGLWLLADREGRLEDRPLRIKYSIFPGDDEDVDALLAGLHNSGLIVRYEAAGGKYIEIPKFIDHQKPHPHEPKSVIPARPSVVTDPDPSGLVGIDPVQPDLVMTSHDKPGLGDPGSAKGSFPPSPDLDLDLDLEEGESEGEGTGAGGKSSPRSAEALISQSSAPAVDIPKAVEHRPHPKDAGNSPPLPETAILEAWNDLGPPFPRVLKLTDLRRRHLRARLAEMGPEKLVEAITQLAATPFTRGENARGWVADFDWLIANSTNVLKVLEGKYADRVAEVRSGNSRASPASGTAGWLEDMERIKWHREQSEER